MFEDETSEYNVECVSWLYFEVKDVGLDEGNLAQFSVGTGHHTGTEVRCASRSSRV